MRRQARAEFAKMVLQVWYWWEGVFFPPPDPLIFKASKFRLGHRPFKPGTEVTSRWGHQRSKCQAFPLVPGAVIYRESRSSTDTGKANLASDGAKGNCGQGR
jgi:hypothetical protein